MSAMTKEEISENYLIAKQWCKYHSEYQINNLREALCTYCTHASQEASSIPHTCNYFLDEQKIRGCIPENCIEAGCFLCIKGKEKEWKKSYDKYKEKSNL
jgi:hypothetical protein